MRSSICIGISIFLFTTLQALSQDLRAFDPVNLTGYWETDSAAQLAAKLKRVSKRDSMAKKAVSGDLDRAVITREYGFFENGLFTAEWQLGTNPTVVNGTWGVVSGNRIFIEVNGNKSVYSLSSGKNGGMILVPQRERRGEVHELYFIKKEVK
nr:hypothetical protein [Cytophagales bacterium]